MTTAEQNASCCDLLCSAIRITWHLMSPPNIINSLDKARKHHRNYNLSQPNRAEEPPIPWFTGSLKTPEGKEEYNKIVRDYVLTLNAHYAVGDYFLEQALFGVALWSGLLAIVSILLPMLA